MAYTPTPELRKIIDKLLDNPPLTKNEMFILEGYLKDDNALFYYLRITQQEVLLEEALCSEGKAPSPVSTQNTAWIRLVAIILIAFLILALGIFIGSRFFTSQPAEVTKPVTSETAPLVTPSPIQAPVITGYFNVTWAPGQKDLSKTASLTDTIKIESGIIELFYARGDKVIIEGPASFSAPKRDSLLLNYGKLTCSSSQHPFVITCPTGTVTSSYSEIALEVIKNGESEVGVYSGSAELDLFQLNSPRSLKKNQALQFSSDEEQPIVSIPFRADKYSRSTPSRVSPWFLNSIEIKEFDFDISPLVNKPGTFNAVFKWIHGHDAIDIYKVSLCKNERPLYEIERTGRAGTLSSTSSNIYSFDLKKEDFSKAKWSIKATVSVSPRALGDLTFEELVPQTAGIMQLIESHPSTTNEQSFIGTWKYLFQGRQYTRTFNKDHTLEMNHRKRPNCWWKVVDGRLKIKFTELSYYEEHMLADENTLIFTNQPYSSAVKVDDK